MHQNTNCVEILLATYNGERFIKEQIESILNQTYTEWKLLIHDDGSDDSTLSILKKYEQLYPLKIKVFDDDIKFGNAKKNFAYLMQKSQAGYIMFCDQDDIWLENKIEISISKLKEVELHNKQCPIIVHTDLTIVDQNLNVIANSMFSYQKIPKYNNYLETAIRNNVTGCTMLINRQALTCSLPVKEDAIMHDWWIALNVLYNKGVIEFINIPTILYRQHSNNTVGAKKINFFQMVVNSRLFKPSKSPSFKEARNQVQSVQKQMSTSRLVLTKWKIIFNIIFRYK